MLTITKRFEFDAAHRLLHHEGKCKNLHGHRYAVEIEIAGLAPLDKAGRVMDFAEVRDWFGVFLDDLFDHATIANAEDTALVRFLEEQDSKCFAMNGDPSVENLAKLLFKCASGMFDEPNQRTVTRLTVFETPTSSATVRSEKAL
jgi:6-pyruvoyltetrahydropterin/6-carboxytetrahydropterin synthase